MAMGLYISNKDNAYWRHYIYCLTEMSLNMPGVFCPRSKSNRAVGTDLDQI